MCYEVEVVQVVKRSVASLSIVVADAHTALIASDGTSVAEQRAMPSFAPTQIIIDIETGRITNWHKPELADVQAYIRQSAHSLAELEQSIAQSKAVFAELEPQSKAIAQRLRDLDGDLPDDYSRGVPIPETAKAQPRQWASSKHFIADLTAANNKQDIGDAAFYLYARLGLVTGIKPVLSNGSGGIKGECINLTEQGHALLGSLMLQTSRLDADKWLNDLIEKTADGELIITQQLPSFHVEKTELGAAPVQEPASQTLPPDEIRAIIDSTTDLDEIDNIIKTKIGGDHERDDDERFDLIFYASQRRNELNRTPSLCTLKKPLAPVQIDIEEQIASEAAKDLPPAPAPEEVELEDGCKVISVEKRGLRWYAKHGHNSSRSEISKEGAVKTLLKKLGIPDAEFILMPNQAAEESNTWRYKVSAPAPVCDIAPMATDAEPEPKYPPVAEIAPVTDVSPDAVKPPTYHDLVAAIDFATTPMQVIKLHSTVAKHEGHLARKDLQEKLNTKLCELQQKEAKAHA